MVVKHKSSHAHIPVLSVVLIILTVSLFAYFGYQSVSYLLSRSFHVATESTVYDLVAGVLAIVASILVFVGSLYAFKLKLPAPRYVLYGSVLFMIKNLVDIVNDLQPLFNSVATADIIDSAAWSIGMDIFQLAFWIFIAIVFTRASFKRMLKR